MALTNHECVGRAAQLLDAEASLVKEPRHRRNRKTPQRTVSSTRSSTAASSR